MGEHGFPTKWLIDGIDRLGKSNLVAGIQNALGYHLVIHYDKPKLLYSDMETALEIKEHGNRSIYSHVQDLSNENLAKFLYQEDANYTMFELLRSDARIIFDRTHLGEVVYAPLYRGYSGDYVYELEEELTQDKLYTYKDDIRLIVLMSSNTDMLKDDGLSFDPTKKNEEQNMFIEAFHKSKLENKVLIDVHDGNGGYRPYHEILKEALKY